MLKNILTYLMPALKLTLVLIILCSFLYPLLITGIAKMSPAGGNGVTVDYKGEVVGYENIGQKFTDDKYFWSRPSAVNYNASGSGGSNKGPTNPDFLKDVQSRIDTFLVHNPGVKKNEIPAELVTYSGSGLDPDISPEGAYVQVARIARTRKLSEEKIKALVAQHTQKP